MCLHIGGHTKVSERQCLLFLCFFCVFGKNILKRHQIKKIFFCFLDFNASMLISKNHGHFVKKCDLTRYNFLCTNSWFNTYDN